MTGGVDERGADTVRDEAVARLVRVQSDAATAEDWAELTAWLEGSELRQRAFEAAEQASMRIDDLAPEIAAGLAAPTAEILPFRRRPAERRKWLSLGRAAAAAGLVVVGSLLWRWSEGPERVYRTGPGEVRNLTLADGSRVRMDAASTLKVHLGWRVRRVEMADAEASFDVAKDPRRPFVITAGDKTVRVVGTMFNIRHYDGLFVLTVSRGIVEVSRTDAGPGPISRLRAGDEVRGRDGSPTLIWAKVDPAAAFAWADNRLVSSDRPLSEIVAFLNRRYAIPIRLTPAAARKRFSGSLELGDQELLLRRLGAFFALPVHRTAHDFTLG